MIYRDVIHKLFALKLEDVDDGKIFINTSPISRQRASALLVDYFQKLAEIAFSAVPENDSIDFINSVIKEVALRFDSNSNLQEISNNILLSIIGKVPSKIEKYLRSVIPFPVKGSQDYYMPEIEMLCSNRIDLKIYSGDLPILGRILKEFTMDGNQLRVVTDSADYFANMQNIQCKISSSVPDSNIMFLHRNSGFHIAYIGIYRKSHSSSLSWNFRATKYDNPDVINSVSKTIW